MVPQSSAYTYAIIRIYHTNSVERRAFRQVFAVQNASIYFDDVISIKSLSISSFSQLIKKALEKDIRTELLSLS